MTLSERLLVFKQEQRYTFRELGELLNTTLMFAHDFSKGKIKRIDPDYALYLDKFLTERGY